MDRIIYESLKDFTLYQFRLNIINMYEDALFDRKERFLYWLEDDLFDPIIEEDFSDNLMKFKLEVKDIRGNVVYSLGFKIKTYENARQIDNLIRYLYKNVYNSVKNSQLKDGFLLELYNYL